MPELNVPDEAMEALKQLTNEAWRNFLNETVGPGMGEAMMPSVYQKAAPPASEEKHVNWSAVINDEDGKDTGMCVQVWNGDGSVKEMEQCSDVAMALKKIHDEKGASCTNKDIAEALRGHLSIRQPSKVQQLCMPPSGWSGSTGDWIRNEIDRIISSIVNSSDDFNLIMKSLCGETRIIEDNLVPLVKQSILETMYGEHPEFLDIPYDCNYRARMRQLIARAYPGVAEKYLDDLVNIFSPNLSDDEQKHIT